jgi:hypothetical protein
MERGNRGYTDTIGKRSSLHLFIFGPSYHAETMPAAQTKNVKLIDVDLRCLGWCFRCPNA